MAYPQVEVQTVEVGGISYTEYRYEHELELEMGETQYISSIKDSRKSTNHYIVTLLNRFTEKEQRVDLVMQESGFKAIMNEIRKHFSYSWEVLSWVDYDTPF